MKKFALLVALLALAACEKKGPLERTGEKVDNAVQDLKSGGETTGDKVGNAIDEATDKVKETAKKVGDDLK